MKIDKYRIEINPNCKKENIKIIEEYWKTENLNFIYKPSNIAKKFNLNRQELIQTIKDNSKLIFEITCNRCNNKEEQHISSQAKFNNINRLVIFHCLNCLNEIEKEEQIEIKIELERKHQLKIAAKKKAITNKSWSNLNNFELILLRSIIKLNDILLLKKKYKNVPKNEVWRAIYKLRDLHLIELHYSEFSQSINKITVLDELKQQLPQPTLPKTDLPKVSYNESTNELKFRLNKNFNRKDNDSPLFSDILEFKNEIILKPGVQYTFGGWKRENGNIFLTLIPTENIYQNPKQTRVSHQPKHIREAIEAYFKQVNKDLDY